MIDDDGHRRMCLVCGRILTHVEGGGWTHGLQDEPADHPAIPVIPTEVPGQLRARCDFCSDEDPPYVIPAESFDIDLVGLPVEAAQGSHGDWAACERCAALVDAGRWADVLRASVRGWESRNGPMHPAIKAYIARLHRQLSKHITGGSRPVSDR